MPKKFEINYKIFTNRYIHSINLFNSIFDFSKSEPKLNFKIISRTDYILNLLFKKKNVTFLFGDYNYNSWHDQLTIFFKKAKIDLSMVAPLNFKNKTKLIFYDGIEKKNKNIELKKNNIFKDQFNNFLEDTKSKRFSQNINERIYLKDYSLINKIWTKI